LRYKCAIKQALYEYEHKFDDALYDHFIRKEPCEFWKCWSNKFNRNKLYNKPQYINGVSGNAEIANEFAKYFSSVYYDSNLDLEGKSSFLDANNAAQLESNDLADSYVFNMIDVELTDKCLRNMKRGKASGPDGLCCESLLHAHPKLISLLCSLFRSMSLHHYVPTNFGKGIIVPLVKDKTGDVSSTNNYRAITLVPIISKLFECVLLHITDEFLNTDDRQFGFKKGLGCANAIFVVRSTVDYFTDRGSNVYAAALDISKAYDRISHVRLFTSLLRTGMPRWVVYLLVDWYGKLQVAVRWMDSLSAYFKVGSGLRQGSSLSPALFNVYINVVILRLRMLDLGCYINKTWVGCILYADDIILLSASAHELQTMLTNCNDSIQDLNLCFNFNKSLCIVFGPRTPVNLKSVDVHNNVIHWCQTCKYLGILFVSGKRMSCDVDYITRKFYAASNSVFSCCHDLDELLQLQLQRSYCLPILQYAAAAIRLTRPQLRSLNSCWNDVYRKIFKFNRWNSVTEFIGGLGYLNYVYLRYLSVAKFIKVSTVSSNLVLRNAVVMFMQGYEYRRLSEILHVNISMPMHTIRNNVYSSFLSSYSVEA
jgi:hypothetical protein